MERDEERELTARAAHVEALLGEIESLPDPAARATVAEIVQGLLALYGAALARMLAHVERQGEGGMAARLLEAFAADDLVSHLLLLHDLHPLDAASRVEQALEAVRPSLQAHGGDVELLGVDGDVARLRLRGNCSGCPSSTATLEATVARAIEEAAPDLRGFEAEGAAGPPRVAGPAGFVPAGALRRRERRSDA